MSEETKDKIAEVILYIFSGAMLIALLGVIIWGLFINPLAVLIIALIVSAIAAICWASDRVK